MARQAIRYLIATVAFAQTREAKENTTAQQDCGEAASNLCGTTYGVGSTDHRPSMGAFPAVAFSTDS